MRQAQAGRAKATRGVYIADPAYQTTCDGPSSRHCEERSGSRVIAKSALVRRSPPSGEGGCDEAIHPSLAARWIASLIGRRGAPTRWLAMTESRPRSCRSAPKRQTRNPRIRRCAMEHLKFDAEPVIGPRFARTRWRPGMTVQIKRTTLAQMSQEWNNPLPPRLLDGVRRHRTWAT